MMLLVSSLFARLCLCSRWVLHLDGGLGSNRVPGFRNNEFKSVFLKMWDFSLTVTDQNMVGSAAGFTERPPIKLFLFLL